ncbi:MAG: DUF4124 domain-containing protein [Pseudomonadales bacterium]
MPEIKLWKAFRHKREIMLKQVILFLLIIFSSTSQAKIYQYEDENGNAVFTNKPPQHTGLADKELKRKNAENQKIICANLTEQLVNKKHQRSKVTTDINREFYLDSQIRVIIEDIAKSCDAVNLNAAI